MRVLLDCRFQRGAGPNVASRYMVDHLVKLNKDFELIILQHEGQPLPNYLGIKKIIVPYSNPALSFFWVQAALPRIIRRYRIDVCHSLKHVGPMFTDIPTILHLREVGHFLPEGRNAFQLDLANKIYWNHILVMGLKRATHIVGVSKYCKAIINERFGIPERKVSVAYQAPDDMFHVIEDRECVKIKVRRLGLPDNYILCVGNFYKHKNYDTVIRMYAKLKKWKKQIPKLVMVGDTSYADRQFFDLIDEMGLTDAVFFPEYVEHNDLVYIYNAADLFLFPAIVASFPNPCLEAMACGVPVVASNRGAIGEVTGGAALMLEQPRDENEMFEVTKRVLDDDHLRKKLREMGLSRVSHFSWDSNAAMLLRLYGSIGRQQ